LIGFARWLRGNVRFEICGGSPQWCLNRLAAEGIAFWDVVRQDSLTFGITVYAKDADRVLQLAERSMCTAMRRNENGLFYKYRGLKKRIPLLAAVILSVVLSVVLPRFIWFYGVEGNERVPSEKIIRAAERAGLRLGLYGPDIDPQSVKDRVLAQIPELSWLTVTQNGACAVIRVRERAPQLPDADRRIPSDLLATRDGLVTELSVLEGSAAVRPGEIVQHGQVLIGGKIDLEHAVRFSAALGEVYARTWRDLYLKTPSERTVRTDKTDTNTVVSLQLGKKRIKISSESGIIPPECVKMTVIKRLTLPNGNTLPIALVLERGETYETESAAVPEEESQKLLTASAQRFALRGAIAGEILKENASFSRSGGPDTLHTVMELREMIAGHRQRIYIEGETTNDGKRSQR